MNTLLSPLALAAISVATTAAVLVRSVRRGAGHGRGWWIGLTALPGLLALSAFYSLALRMHSRLGGWPNFYGNEMLPPELVTHAEASLALYSFLMLLALGMPLVLALFALAPRLRPSMIYPAACGAACWAAFFLTLCAPAGFLHWCWD
jgi:hypothetical protein